MSLILEALRKSEAERRRGMAPDVAIELPPTPASRQRTLAAWLIPALMVAVLLVLAAWWARRDPAKTTPTQAAVEITEPALASIKPTPAELPRVEPGATAPALASAPVPDRRTQVSSMPASATAPTPKPLPIATASPTLATATTQTAQDQSGSTQPISTPPTQIRPPPASDISNDTSMLPPIKLSMHMWDDVPSRRFVILNGQRMAEGDRYGGITVLAIERKGVVVESNGTKARMPLP